MISFQGNSPATFALNDTTYQSYSVTCDEPDNIHQLIISMLNPYTNLIFKFQLNDTSVTLAEVYGYLYIDDKILSPAPIAPGRNISKFVKMSIWLSFFFFYFRIGLYSFTAPQQLFEASPDKSFQCNTKTKIENILNNDNVTITSIDLENLRVQAFYDRTHRFSGYGDGKIRIKTRKIFSFSSNFNLYFQLCPAMLISRKIPI